MSAVIIYPFCDHKGLLLIKICTLQKITLSFLITKLFAKNSDYVKREETSICMNADIILAFISLYSVVYKQNILFTTLKLT